MRYHASRGDRENHVHKPRAIKLAIMVNHSVEQSGLLNENPLAELLREAAVARLSGAFRLAHDRVKSVIYFDAGKLLFAISNVRTNRLSESARKWNFINEHQLTAVGTQLSDLELGAALLESGALTAGRLGELYSLQVESVLRQMLLWVDGTWTFDPRVRLAEDVSVDIHLPQMLMESARHLPLDFVEKRFSNTNELVSIVLDHPMDLVLQPVEAFLLSRVEASGMRLHELFLVTGLPDAQTLFALYPLALGGFLVRDQWQLAFSDQTVSRFRAVEEVVQKRNKESGKTDKPALDKSSVVAPAAGTNAESEVDEEQEIIQFVSRVESAEDFYEVLALTRSADAATVKRTYHSLARRFHPDRFHKEAGTEFHARLQTTFARVAQAYEMLKDKTLRAGYDIRLQNEKKMSRPSARSTAPRNNSPLKRDSSPAKGSAAAGSDIPPQPDKPLSAEETFQSGVSAMDAGNMPFAIALLADAARRDPKVARYRAHYGRALASDKRKRLQAEAELQAAIALDTNNAAYRVMLAELYVEHGMRLRARSEAQRAAAIDPNSKDAQRLLRELSEEH